MSFDDGHSQSPGAEYRTDANARDATPDLMTQRRHSSRHSRRPTDSVNRDTLSRLPALRQPPLNLVLKRDSESGERAKEINVPRLSHVGQERLETESLLT